MSKNLNRVKKNIIKEMDNGRCHDGESWADIMLRNSMRIKTADDQKDFWQWVLDPSEECEIPIVFEEFDPNDISVPEKFTVKLCGDEDEKECDQEFENHIQQIGLTTYIQCKPGMELIN